MHPSHAYMIINIIMQIEVIPILCSLAKIEKPFNYDYKAFKLNNSTLVYYYEHIIIILHASAVILYDINIILL